MGGLKNVGIASTGNVVTYTVSRDVITCVEKCLVCTI